MNVYYVLNRVSQGEQFLANVLHIDRLVKLFEDYSVCSLFLKLACVIIYSVSFEVLDEVTVRVRCRSVEFDDVV
jgi:hypothetical protein